MVSIGKYVLESPSPRDEEQEDFANDTYLYLPCLGTYLPILTSSHPDCLWSPYFQNQYLQNIQ